MEENVEKKICVAVKMGRGRLTVSPFTMHFATSALKLLNYHENGRRNNLDGFKIHWYSSWVGMMIRPSIDICTPLIFAPSNFQNCPCDTYLSDHTLRDLSWVKTVVETETSNMTVRTNSLDTRHVLDFLYFSLHTWDRHLFARMFFGVLFLKVRLF